MADRTPDDALCRLRVDHLVWAVPGTLEEGIAHFVELTGVTPCVGGVHHGLGTHNALVSLGNGAYFEILARDPNQRSPERLWMGMDAMDGASAPRMQCWAHAPDDLPSTVAHARRSGYDPGEPKTFCRPLPDGAGELRWTLAYNHYTSSDLPGEGIVPFLIDWGSSASPAASAPSGCQLIGLRAECVDPAAVSEQLEAVGIDPANLQLLSGPTPRLVATLQTPKGVVCLS